MLFGLAQQRRCVGSPGRMSGIIGKARLMQWHAIDTIYPLDDSSPAGGILWDEQGILESELRQDRDHLGVDLPAHHRISFLINQIELRGVDPLDQLSYGIACF